jgi:hypothetical protein
VEGAIAFPVLFDFETLVYAAQSWCRSHLETVFACSGAPV